MKRVALLVAFLLPLMAYSQVVAIAVDTLQGDSEFKGEIDLVILLSTSKENSQRDLQRLMEAEDCRRFKRIAIAVDSSIAEIPEILFTWTWVSKLWIYGDLEYFAAGFENHQIPMPNHEKIPRKFRRFINLEELQISLLPIRKIGIVGRLKKINVLKLNSILLRRLPLSVGTLKELSTLSVSNSPFQKLPNWIGNLSNLSEINISNTGVKSLPKQLFSCELLRTIDFSFTNVSLVPDEIKSLSNLERIVAPGEIQYCSPSICELPVLKIFIGGFTDSAVRPKCLDDTLQWENADLVYVKR
ncbi:MAG: leucine-rich repeat domain-containing protein [Bacteroidetes bacterium]|nr:leucine-rich repeat domain-containing protein [Bacteroidota bacterium]